MVDRAGPLRGLSIIFNARNPISSQSVFQVRVGPSNGGLKQIGAATQEVAHEISLRSGSGDPRYD